MRPPISDPFLPPAPAIAPPKEETRLFGHSFWRVYFGILGFSLLIGLLLVGAYFWLPFVTAYLEQNGKFLGVILLIINPLASAFKLARLPLKVTPSGIYGSSLGSFSALNLSLIPWERMRRARFLWWGLPYVRVSLQGKPSIFWIPLTLTNFAAFARTLDEWAPAGNPLREWAQKQATKT